MPRAPIKILVAGTVLASAAAYLAVAGVRAGSVYFVGVDQFVTAGVRPGERARLHGRVGEPLDARPADLLASFELLGTSARVPVVFRGPVPAQLRPGMQVVVEGISDEHGAFRADTLLTRCASKYQSEPALSGTAPGGQP